MLFKDEYSWLSNFAPVEIILDSIHYPSVEHAYMSCKNNSKESRQLEPNATHFSL